MEINRINQGGVATTQHENTSKPSKTNGENKVAPQQSLKEMGSIEEMNLSKDAAQKVVEGLNNVMSAFDSHLKFVYHERLQRYFVTVVDSRTEEIVKEIPPKKLLDFFANVSEQMGLIVDHKI